MRKVTIVTPSKWSRLHQRLLHSLEVSHRDTYPVIIVNDGDTTVAPPNVRILPGAKPFCFARNVNIGIRAADPDSDILLLNDDIHFQSHEAIPALIQAMEANPRIGLLAPVVAGEVNNPRQRQGELTPSPYPYIEREFPLSAAAIYIRRELIRTAGYFDEIFAGYGYEDDDYSIRARQAGFDIAILPSVTVLHGEDDRPGSVTFRDQPNRDERFLDNLIRFQSKYGASPQEVIQRLNAAAKPRIAVYAIAKNEAQHVERFLASIHEADYIVVADTGSTDNTVDLLRAGGAQVHSIAVNPWRFDTARNLSLDLVPHDADICFCLDLDEVAAPGWRQAIEAAWTPYATRLRYLFVWSHHDDGSADISFWASKIHSRHGYRWRHPVHEVLTAEGADIPADCTLRVDHYPDAAKPRSSYLPLLEKAVEEDPDDDRNAFYLGREYVFHQMWSQAIQQLERHLALPAAQWPPERAASMSYLATALKELNRHEEAITWLERACTEAPDQREPWVDLAQLCYESQLWEKGFFAARRALSITERPRTYLTHGYAWGHRPYDIAAVCAWNIGLTQTAFAYASAVGQLP